MTIHIHVRNKAVFVGLGESITRPSLLQNHYTINDAHPRDEIIDQYEEYLQCQLLRSNRVIRTALDDLLKIYKKYGKLNLKCDCAPKRCHGDSIKQALINKIKTGEYLVDGKIYPELKS